MSQDNAQRTRLDVNRSVIYASGLPRSGSTLLCQLLAHHPAIYSSAHSSPLAHALDNLRHAVSRDEFFLSQLDQDFELVYGRLKNAYRGLINGWFAESAEDWVVDKNRGWLGMIETVAELDPNFKMLVCIRELSQLYGSIEAQHRKTVLIDTEDRQAALTPQGRAARWFNDGGLVSVPLGTISAALNEIPAELRAHIYFVKYETLVSQPLEAMNAIFAWLGLPSCEIDPTRLDVTGHESDSHYRFKFRHDRKSSISAAQQHDIPEVIRQGLINQFRWYYERFYPEAL